MRGHLLLVEVRGGGDVGAGAGGGGEAGGVVHDGVHGLGLAAAPAHVVVGDGPGVAALLVLGPAQPGHRAGGHRAREPGARHGQVGHTATQHL